MTTYKQTEVGLIPSDWEVKRLGEIVENGKISSGIFKEQTFYGSGSQIIKLGDIFKNDYFEPSNTQRLQISNKEKLNYEVYTGDIFIALASVKLEGVGKVMFVDKLEELTVYDHNVALIRALEYVNKKFLFYLLKSHFIREKIGKLSTQVGTTFLKSSSIKAFLIPLPPLAEQTAIATVLADTDALISGLEQLIAKKRAIKQGAMQTLLQPQAGWVVKRLGEVLIIRHGKDQKGVQSENGVYPILGTGGLMGYSNTFLYDKESVLIGRKGTIDKPRYMNSPFWTVDTLFYSEIKDFYSAKFIYYVFLLINWYSHNEASGVPSLNAKTIENIEASFPNYKEQTRIATILGDMDAEIGALEGKLAKYRGLKLGLMQNLLTGRVRLV